VHHLTLSCQYASVFPFLHVDFTGLEADDMASPHRSESFFYDGPASPSILLVPTGDGDSFDVVLGPVLTLIRSEEASLEQGSPLAAEPAGDELLLIEGWPSHASSSPDRQPLMTTDGRVSTERVAVDDDSELDESWLVEQLFHSPEIEVPVSEGLAEPHASSGTLYFLYHLPVFHFSMYSFFFILFCSRV
jgi:hypothetical protein